MICACARALRSMVSTACRWFTALKAGSRNSAHQPRIAFSGVRSSCDSVARNSSLSTPRRSASARAKRSEASKRSRSSRASRMAEMSRAILDAPMMRPPESRIGETVRGDVHEPPVARSASRLVMLDAVPGADLREDRGLFVQQLVGNQHRDRLADRFVRRVAEQTLRGGIPRHDHPFQGLADDDVVRGFDNRREPGEGDLRRLHPVIWRCRDRGSRGLHSGHRRPRASCPDVAREVTEAGSRQDSASSSGSEGSAQAFVSASAQCPRERRAGRAAEVSSACRQTPRD